MAWCSYAEPSSTALLVSMAPRVGWTPSAPPSWCTIRVGCVGGWARYPRGATARVGLGSGLSPPGHYPGPSGLGGGVPSPSPFRRPRAGVTPVVLSFGDAAKYGPPACLRRVWGGSGPLDVRPLVFRRHGGASSAVLFPPRDARRTDRPVLGLGGRGARMRGDTPVTPQHREDYGP